MPVYYQPPMTHALPPPTPAGIPPAHSGEIPPPIPTSEAQAQSTSTDGPARIIALEDDSPVVVPAINAVTEETPSRAYIRLAQENEELNNWTSVLRYSAVVADV
ncbi:hypothetical protein CDL15_Pgr011058 [Punica granatum]|uniref:Uncharacterized protein n=1 Tax=Punica granatum TaxID=22663 RepID=A0A218XMU5_PUNGR|nr:hypothetical protein CDL15_Pgr011058 [Punica granatum]